MAYRRELAVALLFAFSSFVVVPAARAQEQDNSWSGYLVEGPDLGLIAFPGVGPFTTFGSVTATWIEPEVVCPVPNARVSIWVGLDGHGTPTVEQAGTFAECVEYFPPFIHTAFWEMYSGPNSMPGGMPFYVYPGDLIQASVTYLGNNLFRLQLTDVTNGGSFSVMKECDPSVTCYRGTAEWIIERPGIPHTHNKYPLAEYGGVSFFGLDYSSDGAIPTYTEIDMVDKSNANTLLSTCQSSTPPPPLAFICSWSNAE
jgi:hypothetical protein